MSLIQVAILLALSIVYSAHVCQAESYLTDNLSSFQVITSCTREAGKDQFSGEPVYYCKYTNAGPFNSRRDAFDGCSVCTGNCNPELLSSYSCRQN